MLRSFPTTQGKTLAAVSTLSGELAAANEKAKGVEVAKQVGLALAKACKEKNITQGDFRPQRVSFSWAGEGGGRWRSRRWIGILTASL